MITARDKRHWGSAVLVLAVWLWLGSLGGAAWLVDVMRWLNQHSGAVQALTGLGNLLVTVAIAGLTIGTWRLYELERSRARIDLQRFAASLLHVAALISGVRELLERAAHDLLYRNTREVNAADLRRALERLDQLSDAPGAVPLQTLAHIDAARELAATTAAFLEGANMGAPAVVLDLADRLRKAQRAVQAAYQVIPPENRAEPTAGVDLAVLWYRARQRAYDPPPLDQEEF